MTTTERVRFTIACEPEVYEAFADLAHTSGVSLSRCIGDWLRDTAEAAQMTTIKLNEVRRTPQEAFEVYMRDGMVPEILRIQEGWRTGKLKRWSAAAGGAPGAAGGPVGAAAPPASNTGGKVPPTVSGRARKQGSQKGEK